MSESRRFKSFGEQLRAVVGAEMSKGAAVDERLFPLNEGRAEVSGLSESTPSAGGWLVEPEFAASIVDTKSQSYPIPGMCVKLRLKRSGSIRLPAWDTAVTVYTKDEAVEKTKSHPRFAQLEMSVNKITALCYATDEMLEDSALLAGWLESHAREAVARQLQQFIIRGTGAGMPQGIVNSPCLVQVARAGANAIGLADVTQMWEQMWAAGKSRCVWLINSQTVMSQIGNIALANVFDNASHTLLSRPVIEIDACPTLGHLGDIILADLSQYVLVDREEKGTISIHVRFIFDESVFRFVYRVDGEPTWAATETVNGVATSPFIALTEKTSQ